MPKGDPGGVRGTKSETILGAIFGQKSKKLHPKWHQKIDAEKVSKNDAKGSQNDAKMDAKNDDFSIFDQFVNF